MMTGYLVEMETNMERYTFSELPFGTRFSFDYNCFVCVLEKSGEREAVVVWDEDKPLRKNQTVTVYPETQVFV